MKITLQTATPGHGEAIVQSQLALAQESENLTLDEETVRKGVAYIFHKPERGEYMVALRDGAVVGCLLQLYEWSEWRCGDVIWVHSVYINKECRGQGLFKKMYQTIQTKVLESDHLRGIRLYVDKSNEPAIKVYEALGMNGDHYHLYEWLE